MSTTDSIDFLLTRDNIIQEAMELVGALAHGASPTAADLTSFARTLNGMVKSWQTRGIFLWTVDDYQVQLKYGSKIVGSDGNAYVCIKNHEAAASNKPITGPEYTSYWLQDGSVSDWAASTAYTIGNVVDSDGANTYKRCIKDHTSDSAAFATDDALGYWETADWNTGFFYQAINHVIFPPNVFAIEHGCFLRDATGTDHDVTLVDRQEYNSISDKMVYGEPNRLFVTKDRRFDSQQSATLWQDAQDYSAVAIGSIYYTDTTRVATSEMFALIEQHNPSAAAVNKPYASTAADYYNLTSGVQRMNGSDKWKPVSPTEGFLYPMPTDDRWVMHYQVIRTVEDFDAAGDHPDFPIRWTEALTWGLASRLSYKYSLPLDERTKIENKAEYFFQIALDDSHDAGSIQFGIDRR